MTALQRIPFFKFSSFEQSRDSNHFSVPQAASLEKVSDFSHVVVISLKRRKLKKLAGVLECTIKHTWNGPR